MSCDGTAENCVQRKTFENYFKALDHARGLFIYHAGQRLTSIRFFLIFFSASLVALIQTATSDSISDLPTRIFLCGCLSLVGVVVVIIFFFLDRRNAMLVELDEDAIIQAEDRISESLFEEKKHDKATTKWTTEGSNEKTFNIMIRARSPKSPVAQYSKLIPGFFIFCGFIYAILVVFSFFVFYSNNYHPVLTVIDAVL